MKRKEFPTYFRLLLVVPVLRAQMMVHKGFLDAYDSVRRTVFTLLDEITGSNDKDGQWRVIVTGHSLGGALATLAAYELAERRYACV